MKKTASDILKKARALIEDGICYGFAATDKNGDWVPLRSKNATHFCSVGALERSAGRLNGRSFETQSALNEAYNLYMLATGEDHVMVSAYHDDVKNKKHILSVFNTAIDIAETL